MYYAQHVYGIGIFIRILQLFFVVQCQCPEYFRYYRNETTSEIMGTVEIPTPPQGVPLHLRVILSVATVLPTKYVGRIELAKSREESIREILQSMPLYYKIYFPVRNPIPVVTSITLNDHQFCLGNPAIGIIITNIILEHNLFPPQVIIPLTEHLLDFISNHTSSPTAPANSKHPAEKYTTTEKQMITTPPSIRNTSEPPIRKGRVDYSCGLIGESHSVIPSDEITSPIMWPWLAAIYVMRDDIEFQCAGNLISRLYVLTVAHCLRENEVDIPADMLFISLGRFNLHDWKEPESVNLEVTEYKVHPNYKNSQSADSDLALIKVVQLVNYAPNIRPICLWMGKVELDEVIGKFGYVVGWGADGTKKHYSAEPRMSRVPIVSQEDCVRSNPGFIEVTSNRTFCAGRRDGTGPCISDSGSGLIMYHSRYSRYHLRGIVSLSMIDVQTGTCDLHEYTVYVDVAKYLPWIRHEIMT